MRPLRSASIAALRFCGVTPALAQDLAGLVVLLERERKQQPLDGDETVARLLAGLLGGVEHARQRRIEIELPGPAALDLGALGERRLDGAAEPRASARRSGRSGPPRAPPGRRAGLSADVRGRIAGGPRAGPATGRTGRNRGRGPCISRYSFLTPSACPGRPEGAAETSSLGFLAPSMTCIKGACAGPRRRPTAWIWEPSRRA